MAARAAWRICSTNKWWTSLGKKRGTKNLRSGPAVHDDLVARKLLAGSPNMLWLTDITEHHTSEGKLYLCAVKDVFSNRIGFFRFRVDARDGVHVDARRVLVADALFGDHIGHLYLWSLLGSDAALRGCRRWGRPGIMRRKLSELDPIAEPAG